MELQKLIDEPCEIIDIDTYKPKDKTDEYTTHWLKEARKLINGDIKEGI